MLTIWKADPEESRFLRTLALTGDGNMRIGHGVLFRSNRSRIRREILNRDLIATFNLLVDAVALEKQCGSMYARRPDKDSLRQWNLCRRTVERLGKEYSDSVGRYRQAVKDNLAPKLRKLR